MASGSESGAERVSVKWEVAPTNDVVLALMETLVDPRLPYRVSVNDPPSIDAQTSVAKQMHAVVLLYNYYHRKQDPELEFLDFVSFSKLALSLRLSLTTFMKMTNESESTVVDDHRLSVTEKAVKDACGTTVALDTSKDVPTTEGWPISKVAVMVIDSKNENCLLRFGAVTEGVWSLFEKELNEYDVNEGILAKEKVGTKRKSSSWKATEDSKFLQIAFDAVKDIAGIDRVDLVVLETHVTYSLSKEKSAAQFYMMQCRKPLSTNQIVPLKFLVKSLQGPLAKKYDDRWTATTDFVDYHQMLPYVGFVSNWLSRKDLCLPSSNDHNARSTMKSGEKELNQSRIVASPRSEYLKNLPTKGPSQNTVTDENVPKKLNKRSEVADSVKGRIINSEIFDNDDYEYLKGSLSGTSKGMMPTISEFTKACSKSEDTSKKLNSKIVVYDKRRENISSELHGAHAPDDGGNLKVDMPDVLKSNDTLCRDNKKKNAEKGDLNISCNQSGVAVTENPIVPFQALYNIKTKNKQDSEDLQNALALLYRKRQELCSQICTMEDELGLYEDCIQRIRDGGEVVLARQCIKSIISGNNDLLSEFEIQDQTNSQSEKQTGLSDIFLPGRFSCQDLEYICLKNNWRMPRYFVEPSGGKLLSNVAVGSKKFELSLKGGLECSPCKARESAAAQMIAKLRERFSGD